MLGSVSVVLTAALLVGWVLVIYRNQVLTQDWVGNAWLMAAGIVFFIAIMTVLVLFSVFLAREILEVRRHTSFTDSVTHELRSPLASLRLCLETMARPDVKEHQREQLRDMMQGDVERLSAFVDDILESNRLAYGREPRRFETIELRGLVERSAEVVVKRHRIDADAITIEVPPDLVLNTDPVALEVVLRNLLDNAVKYSDPPPVVRVIAMRHPKGLEIAVADQGVGIPRHALKRVFHRFYRVSDESVRSRRGTGLGLYVVAALVRGLGGRMRAYSEGPGEGTRMEIRLPLRTLVASEEESA